MLGHHWDNLERERDNNHTLRRPSNSTNPEADHLHLIIKGMMTSVVIIPNYSSETHNLE